MATAYDHYAIKAFEVDSIDYLLKPIGLPDLQRAIERYRNRRKAPELDIARLRAALAPNTERNYKQRYLLRFNEKLAPTRFFCISHNCIISNSGIGSVARRLGNRLELKVKPDKAIDSFVSRAKTAEFIAWLENGEKKARAQ